MRRTAPEPGTPGRLDRELGPDTGTTVLWRPTGPEELELVRQSGWRTWPPRLPGDIIFYTYPGESVPHHVVMYLGGDRIIEAPQTGENVRYGALSEFPDQIASVRRIELP